MKNASEIRTDGEKGFGIVQAFKAQLAQDRSPFRQHKIGQYYIIAIEKTRHKLHMQTSSEDSDAKLDTLSGLNSHLIEEVWRFLRTYSVRI